MKYKLTSNTKIKFGRKLFQIEATASFGVVSKGDKGGWIEKESNLSQDGNAWVYGNARVSGNAVVCDNAVVCGNARVSGNAWVCGNARVSGNAEVRGNAVVSGNAVVTIKIKNLIGFDYNITILDKHIQIGCELHTFDDWFSFSDKRILEMDGKRALKFWKTWKPILQTMTADQPANNTE